MLPHTSQCTSACLLSTKSDQISPCDVRHIWGVKMCLRAKSCLQELVKQSKNLKIGCYCISAANVSIRGNRTRPIPFDPNLRSEMEMVLCFNLHHLLFCTAVGVVRFKVLFSGITYSGVPFSLNYYLFIIDGILLSFSLSACQTTHVWDIRACRIHYDSSQNNSPSNPFL